MEMFSRSILLLILTAGCFQTAIGRTLSTSMTVDVNGPQILVDGKPFFIKGVIYSPSPIGSHPSWTWPYGDFFIPQYAELWQRDFPLLKALGCNTIRIYGWNNDLDHGYFLDQAHRAGLKVIVTFQMGNAWQNPIHEEWQRQQHLGRFTWQFRKYLNHPALLAWSFGEQLNLPGNGYLQAFSDAYQCGWNGGDYLTNPDTGCYNNADTASSCAGSIACVYEHFFGFLNSAASYAKNVMGEKRAHLIIASISDVDVAWLRTQQFNYVVQNLDGWGLQIYRGKDFGQGKEDFIKNYETATTHNAHGELVGPVKPLIVVEYGIDAYNDPCGTGYETPCYNDVLNEPHGGYGEDESSQAEWGASLAKILSEHNSALGLGAVAGGTINSYIDEAWHCTSGVSGCSSPIPYPLPGFDASMCAWKSHVQCPNLNLWHKSLCGFWTPATFDSYTNVGWFGILKPSPVVGDIDQLTPRLLYGRLQEQWSDVNHNWLWIGLLITSLAIACSITYHFHLDYTKRTAQVKELELRTGSSSLMNSARNSVGGRSPSTILAGGLGLSPGSGLPSAVSPKPGIGGGRSGNSAGGLPRSQPLGRSSRATSQTSTTGSTGGGSGSRQTSGSHTKAAPATRTSTELPGPIQIHSATNSPALSRSSTANSPPTIPAGIMTAIPTTFNSTTPPISGTNSPVVPMQPSPPLEFQTFPTAK